MKKILSFCAAMLVALAVNAQEIPSTDFAEGYFFGANQAVLDGNIELNTLTETPYLRYFDRQENGTATWQIQATKACYVHVTLNMFDNSWNNATDGAYKNGGHIFEVKVFNEEVDFGSVAEAAESSAIGDIALDGTIRIPAAGTYAIRLLNSREWSKCGIKGVTLTAEALPETDFAAPGYFFDGANAVLAGNIEYNTSTDTHYLRYNDKQENGTATWKITATRACYVSVTLNLCANAAGPKNGGHKFEVKAFDANGVELGSAAEAAESDGIEAVTLADQILLPEAGDYTIQLLNNREWSKSGILGVTFTYAKPVVADGFYLIYADWNLESLGGLFEKNPADDNEYRLSTYLQEGYAIKVVKVEDNEIKAWYPDGLGGEYVADAAHAGNVTIYFREEYQQDKEDWKAFGGYIYIAPNGGTVAIDNSEVVVKEQKIVENGQMFILKNGVRYNAQGAVVK